MNKLYPPDRIRNIALVGPHSSGKTTLAEALLYSAGEIKEMGSIDKGNTVMDFEDEEIEYKMSIHSAVAHFEWEDVKVNLVDTPGVSDFVGDVRAALRVVEGFIFVVDASKGVDFESERLWHYADDYNVARVVFVNKMDSPDADFFKVVEELQTKFKKPVIPIQIPIGKGDDFKGSVDLIHRTAVYPSGKKVEKGEVPAELDDVVSKYREKLLDEVAEVDDEVMEKYLAGEELTEEEILNGLKKATQQYKIIPVLCGSALKDIGVFVLLDVIKSSLPSPLFVGEIEVEELGTGKKVKRHPSDDEPFLGFVFKTRVDPYAGKTSLVRIRSGVLKQGMDIFDSNNQSKERVNHIFIVDGKKQYEVEQIGAGDIVMIPKLESVHTGNTVSDPSSPVLLPPLRLPQPTYFLSVRAKDKKQEDKLAELLNRAAEEDPTFIVEYRPETKEMVVSCQGEMQAKLVFERIKEKYGIEVVTSVPKVPYRETITTQVDSHYKHKKQTGGHGQYGEVFIKVEPLPRGEGFEFVDQIVGGRIPKQFIPGVEKGVKEAMEEGPLAKFPVTDVKVILYDGSTHPVDSSELSFKIAGFHAMKQAMEKAKPVLLEPIMNVTIYTTEEFLGPVMDDLNSRRGRIMGIDRQEGGTNVIKAQVPLAEMFKYAASLTSITKGLGSFEMEHSHYEIVPQREAEEVIRQRQKELEEEKG